MKLWPQRTTWMEQPRPHLCPSRASSRSPVSSGEISKWMSAGAPVEAWHLIPASMLVELVALAPNVILATR